eukprot:5852202-Amphidinium_carterae.1
MFAFVGKPNNLVCTAAPQELGKRYFWLVLLVLGAVLHSGLGCTVLAVCLSISLQADYSIYFARVVERPG